ncbi:MAG: LysM peptidoglycan-binding domain-containing protein [Acidimicrobiia bacterium]|nr:LysM peptidoglycan-binding domain-containing protein [Acidimicrobiia bacterium]MDH5236884.1 LysM peptidoglycan-binding domain-containing protein [Acidimicrobiia bacterium]
MSSSDATPPQPADPRHRSRQRAVAAVAVAALAGQMAAGTYIVKKGDTLWSLSQAEGTTVGALARANGIQNPDLILIGQELHLNASAEDSAPTADSAPPPRPDRPAPSPAAPAGDNRPDSDPPKPADRPQGGATDAHEPDAPESPGALGGSYTVTAGDTLWSIAQATGTTVSVLKAVNGLHGNAVQPGQKIELPSNGPTPTAPASNGPAAPAPVTPTYAPNSSSGPAIISIYKVQRGDTATSIAARFVISIDEILRANQLTSEGQIRVDQYLRIPSAS